jgi:hypothetical protein
MNSPGKAAARAFILDVCRQLEAGAEQPFDLLLVRAAFPPDFGGRTAEEQLVAELQAFGLGTYECRRDVATGDYIVSRRGPPVGT